MALAKKIIEDFNRVYAPVKREVEMKEIVSKKTIDRQDDHETHVSDGAQSETMHMDTCKL